MRKLLFASFKVIYRINHWMRRRFTSNGTLILLITPVAGVFGLNTRATLSFQIFSVTLILLMVSMLYALLFRGNYSIKRVLPEYVSVGTQFNYTCLVENQDSKNRKGLVLQDELQNTFPSLNVFKNSNDPLDKKRNRLDRFIGYPKLVNIMQKLRGASIDAVPINYIAAKSNVKTNISLTPLRRGYLHFDNLKLMRVDPTGLFMGIKEYVQKDKLLVIPKLYRAPLLNLHGKRAYQHGGINNASAVGDSQEFISLRDYRAGDPIKSIHWRSFAKLSKPVVKEFQDEFFVRYGLVMDTYLTSDNNELFEDAVSISASFMTSEQEQDALIDLMFVGNNAYRLTSGRGLGGSGSILETLACIEPSHKSNIDDLLILIKQHLNNCSALIIVLLDLDEERKKLLSQFAEYNIPIITLLITDNDSQKRLHMTKDNALHFIRHGHIQSDLEKLVN